MFSESSGPDGKPSTPKNGPIPHPPVNSYGSSQQNCNTIEVTHGKEKGQTPLCAAPCGPFRQKGSVPFSSTEDS